MRVIWQSIWHCLDYPNMDPTALIGYLQNSSSVRTMLTSDGQRLTDRIAMANWVAAQDPADPTVWASCASQWKNPAPQSL